MIKRTILAACVAAFGLVALPALAAAEPVTNNPGDPFLEGVKEGTKFTTVGGEMKLTASLGTIRCQKYAGSGEFFDPETGSLSIIFEGCTGPLGSVCTSSGLKSGAIKTTTLPFHLKTIEHEGTMRPGVLITPGPEEVSHGKHFFTFVCGSANKIVVGGNGLVGTITAPNENEASETATISFSSTESGSPTQTHRKVTNDNTEYDLKGSVNGGETQTFALDAEGVITFGEEMKPTLKTTPLE